MDLDDLLTRAAPPTTARSVGVREALRDLVADTEGAVLARHRGRRRVAVVGVGVAASLGLGAVASAAGVLPGWPAFRTSSGQTCSIQVVAEAVDPADIPGVPRGIDAGEARATVDEARRFLSGYNFDDVDPARAETWWREQEARARDSQEDPAERAPALRGDDLDVTAVSLWVVDALRRHLSTAGLDIRAVRVWTSNDCRL